MGKINFNNNSINLNREILIFIIIIKIRILYPNKDIIIINNRIIYFKEINRERIHLLHRIIVQKRI
jgi:hypothetical protein